MISTIRRIATILLALLTLATGLATASAAQESADDLLPYLPGLESAYARKYIAADHVHSHVTGIATPVATPVIPGNTTEVVTATVLEFDSETSLTTALVAVVNDDLAKSLMGAEEMEVQAANLDGVGDWARLFLGATGEGEDREVRGLLLVKDGHIGYIISATGRDLTVKDTLLAFAHHMLAAEPGPEPVIYGDAADSHGGTFDLLPSSRDGLFLGTLVPMYDYDLLNVGNEPIDAHATPPQR